MVVAAAMMLFANAPAVADHVHPDQIKPVPHHTPVPPPKPYTTMYRQILRNLEYITMYRQILRNREYITMHRQILRNLGYITMYR